MQQQQLQKEECNELHCAPGDGKSAPAEKGDNRQSTTSVQWPPEKEKWRYDCKAFFSSLVK
jgi:hypothetical protein